MRWVSTSARRLQGHRSSTRRLSEKSHSSTGEEIWRLNTHELFFSRLSSRCWRYRLGILSQQDPSLSSTELSTQSTTKTQWYKPCSFGTAGSQDLAQPLRS